MQQIMKKYRPLILIFCILFCTVFSVVIFCTRTQPHVDEVWSYMLSNKYDSPFLFTHAPGIGDETDNLDNFIMYETESYKEYYNHWHDGEYYRKAITVQSDERFAYDRVYYNQEHDIHPPLYYFLLHTICSLFPDQFSWWYAFSINLAFYIGTMVMIFAIAKKIGMNDIRALLSVLLWGLSASGTNEICFLRMYMMLTFLMMCITYLHICLIQHFSVKLVAGIMVLDILGFLTQYYAYIYVFFITLFYVIYMLYKRRYKQGIIFGIAILMCVGIAVGIFPAVIRHVFSGAYSSSVTYGSRPSILNSLLGAIVLTVQSYSGLYADFYHVFPYILIGFLLLHFIVGLNRIQKEENVKDLTVTMLGKMCGNIIKKDIRYLRLFPKKFCNARRTLLVVSVLAASTVIYQYSPDMGVLTIRYLFLILPLYSVLGVYYTGRLLSYFGSKYKKVVLHQGRLLCILCVLSIIGSHLLTYPSYFIQNVRKDDCKAYFENSRVILVDTTHHTQAFTPLLMNTVETYPTDMLDESVINILRDYSGQDVPLYLVVSSNNFSSEEIEEFLSGKVNYSLIGEYYCTTDDPAYHYFYQLT